MKRRHFIQISTASTALVIFPILSCNSDSNLVEKLTQSTLITNIYDDRTIHEIGKIYLELFPEEADKDILIGILKGDFDNEKLTHSSGKSELQESIRLKIKNDFNSDHTIIVDGWILSKTETRQCALLSIINN